MVTQHPYRSIILPVPDEIPRPLWSVMIPTYNCADYLRETLASVLAQDLGSELMQIEVIDDHSTKDDPESVVRTLAGDRVSFYRHPENVGYIKNFNTCLQRSRGQLVHLLHGDDCVRDGFYQKMQHGFDEDPQIGAAFCRHIFIDHDSHWQNISSLEETKSSILNNWLERITVKQLIQAPSIVVKRHVYEKLGGFDSRMSCWGEDWEMWVRIAAQYLCWYETEPLALYRKSLTSLTGSSTRSGKNIQDFRKAINIVNEYLQTERANKLKKIALKNYSYYALGSAKNFVAKGDAYGAINQVREAFLCNFSLIVAGYSLKLSLYFLLKMMTKIALTN